MTDIKERLRGNSSHWSDVMRQAADEIERLEARVAELEGALDDLVLAVELPGDHCELVPAAERARAALAKSRGECRELHEGCSTKT